MLTSLIGRISWNIGYMKEMVIGDRVRRESACLTDVKSNTLGHYYMDLRRVVTLYHLWPPMTALDEDGVTRADFSRWGRTDIGIQYHPIAIAQYALANLDLFLDTGSGNYRQAFFAQADWLMKNARVTTAGATVWEFGYSFTPRYDLSIPWVSAMAQGQIISVLLRAYQMTEDIEYYHAAEGALRAFHLPTLEEGVSCTDDEGLTFYEEYPSRPPCHVLNGHIWALFGLYDYYRATSSQEALSLFNAGIDTLKRYLPRYDTGHWSAYDLLIKPGYAPVRYHRYHIELLKVLYEITDEDVFIEYVRRWSRYLSPLRKARFACHVAGVRLSEYLENRRSVRSNTRPDNDWRGKG